MFGYSLCLAHSLQRGLAFSAFGEQVFMLVQTAVLVALLYRDAPPPALRTAVLWGAYAAAAAAYLSGAHRSKGDEEGAGGSGVGAEALTAPLPRTFLFAPNAGALSPRTVEAGFALSNLVFWYARLPQLWANHRARSTGSLSAASVAMQCAGGAVRVLTTLQAGGGAAMLASYCVSLGLNAAMLAQCVAYGGGGGRGGARGRVRAPGSAGKPSRRRAKQG